MLARISPRRAASTSALRLFSSSPAAYLPPKKAVAVKPVVRSNPSIKKTSFVKPKRKGGWGSFSFNPENIPNIEPEDEHLPHIPQFNPSSLTQDVIGNLLQYERATLQEITRNWGRPTAYERGVNPMTVPRKLTLELTKRLDAYKENGFQDSKIILNGGSGCGKSALVHQSVVYAMQTGWLVMYIPRAFHHTNSSYAYHHSSVTSTFHQPSLCAELLSSFIELPSNRALLANMPLVKDYVFTPDYPAGTGGKQSTEVVLGAVAMEHEVKGKSKAEKGEGRRRSLVDLCKLGVDHLGVSVQVLETVFEILSKQKETPFLFAMDSAQAYFGRSEYKTPEGHPLESYHLSVPRLFLDYISGRKEFTSGAFLLSLSISQTDTPVTPSLLTGLGLAANQVSYQPLGGANGGPFTPQAYPLGPEETLQKWHVENAKALRVLDVPEGMTVAEAKGLWQAKIEKKSFHLVNSDEHFLSKYVESGGNPREFFRSINYSTQ